MDKTQEFAIKIEETNQIHEKTRKNEMVFEKHKKKAKRKRKY